MTLPTTTSVFLLPDRLLREARHFFQDRGAEGCEGTALLVGRPENGDVRLTRLFIPEQRCIKERLPDGRIGLLVELTEHAHYTLTDTLASGELFYARIHSHPGEAFHSVTDDDNGVITHRGALSIVIPYFAVAPIDLQRCAIFRLEHGRGWLSLDADEIGRTFEVTDE